MANLSDSEVEFFDAISHELRYFQLKEDVPLLKAGSVVMVWTPKGRELDPLVIGPGYVKSRGFFAQVQAAASQVESCGYPGRASAEKALCVYGMAGLF